MGDGTTDSAKPDSQSCDNPEFKIYTFTKPSIESIHGSFPTIPNLNAAKKLFADNEITYYIDPSLKGYEPYIKSQLEKIDLLFPDITIKPVSDPSSGPVDITFTQYEESDYNDPNLNQAAAGSNIGKKQIRLNMHFLEDNIKTYGAAGIDITEPLLNRIVSHEMTHYFGMDHTDSSTSPLLREMGEFFQSTNMDVYTQVGDKELGKSLVYESEVIGPLDMYELPFSTSRKQTFWEWLTWQEPEQRKIDYVSYYKETGNLLEPEVDANGIAHIKLGQWAIDQQVLMFEMPDSRDLAVVTSTGFVVIHGILDSKYKGFDIQINDYSGQFIKSSEVMPSNGAITLDNMQSALGSTLNNLDQKWKDWAVQNNALQTQSGDYPAQKGDMPTLDWWSHYCTTSYLEDAKDTARLDAPNVVASSNLIFKS